MTSDTVDSSNNQYFETNNVRITVVKETWDRNHSGVRIQAYKGKGKSLFQGAEIPIRNQEEAYELLETLISALKRLTDY